ncbi:poly(R)-hydroxyalkanoic acid synthase subunit PhaE [Bacillus sp. JJ722]|uniref:poly(R)-hydroxyalkanoic acid synthase subunit PhaE n=1 Tax=Bacillus sp. JJ722 TaxID=3122973 RepID=UPI00300040CD
MAEKTTMDPFSLWKSLYDKTEGNLSEVINETLKTEAFSEWLGQVQSGYLQYQELVQNSTDVYLKQINMPTREEISSIASLVIQVEEKVESLDQKIDDELLNNPVAAEIAKLKTSISKLDRKMDQILKVVKTAQLEQEKEVDPTITIDPKSEQKNDPTKPNA